MNLYIAGDGTLGSAVRKCCADHFNVNSGMMTLDVLWICHDTPIGADNKPDADWVFGQIKALMPVINPSVLVLISSQVPSGFVKRCEEAWPRNPFAYCPENVRAAHAEADFRSQARFILGVRKPDVRLDKLFAPFAPTLLVSVESAEMIKHAINGFLAMSVAYANELEILCKRTGANMDHVTIGLRTDPRIGKSAYVAAGGPYGAHLEREVFNLNKLGTMPVISAIRDSNDQHKLRVGFV